MKWIIQDIDDFANKDFLRHLEDYLVVKNIKDIKQKDVKYCTKYILRGSVDFVSPLYGGYPKKFIEETYSCNYYYPNNQELLLNSDRVYFPWGELKKNKSILFHLFQTDKLFIRPDSGMKIFTGTYVTRKHYEDDLDIIFKNNPLIQNDTLVLISSFKEIISEYRVLVGNKKVIDYSIYSGEEKINSHYFDFFAKKFDFSGDLVYTLDIAKDSYKNHRIVELNSFCCSGLYNMNYENVIKNVELIYGEQK